ncbi:hypothetical protein [Curtanaerobium respiraculi]|uniref:hypothetical protein n=1 Tax=Curtanaerobium respiraculi TaxID=2949669 RepID=UPI0024B32A3A|nr:hypothetical protein [Curtanaerobium respiraculi]
MSKAYAETSETAQPAGAAAEASAADGKTEPQAAEPASTASQAETEGIETGKQAGEGDSIAKSTPDVDAPSRPAGSSIDGALVEANDSSKAASSEPESSSSAVQPRAAKAPARAGGKDAGAHVHCTITTEDTVVSNGQYVSFNVNYKIDHGAIHEGDYIVVKIPDSLKNVDLQLDPKHFKGFEKQGEGTYHLIFNDNADGIAGSFALNATASNESSSAITAEVDVNGAKTAVTIAGQTPSGSGVEKDIEKSAFDGSDIHAGGYDYSTGMGKDATEIGIYTTSMIRMASARNR